MLIILRVQLKLQAALRVQLVHGNLRAVGNGVSVNRGSTGQRSNQTDLHGVFGKREGRGQRHHSGKRSSEQLLHIEFPLKDAAHGRG